VGQRATSPLIRLGLLALAACQPPALVPARMLERLGATPPPEVGSSGATLSEESAVALALERNLSLPPVIDAQAVAKGEMRAATQVENPSVQLERKNFNLPIQQAWQLGLKWSPPKPWVMQGRYDQATDQLHEAEATTDEERLSLSSQVRTEHAQLVALEEELKVATEGIDKRRHLADAITARVERGAGTRLDVLAAQASLAQATAAQQLLAAEKAAALERMRALLDLKPGVPLSVVGTLDDVAGAPAVGELEHRALEKRPQLRALEARYAQRAQAVSLAKLERVPWFRFVAAPRLEWQPVQDRDLLTVGVEVTLPVWNWNLGTIAVEEARLKQQADLYQAQLSQLRREISVAITQLRTRREVVEQYARSVVPTLKARVDAANQALQGGQLDTIVLYTAEDALLEANMALVRARRDVKLARIDIERAVGSRLEASP
jgi:multidrug efflux system outer membrane protein